MFDKRVVEITWKPKGKESVSELMQITESYSDMVAAVTTDNKLHHLKYSMVEMVRPVQCDTDEYHDFMVEYHTCRINNEIEKLGRQLGESVVEWMETLPSEPELIVESVVAEALSYINRNK